MRTALALVAIPLILCAGVARAQTFAVEPADVADEKAVFATVESREVVPARVRTGGTIASLSVREGDWVTAGQVVATIGDEKLTLQISSLDAQIAGLKAQLEQSQTDLARATALVGRGIMSKAQFDAATTAADVAANALKSRTAERSVLEQQLAEGQVLAPTAGRVLKVPVTVDAVVMSGETIATIARADFVLRLRVPERHARFLKVGDRIRIDGSDIGKEGATFGTISLVYPQIENGRVVADARVAGLGDYFLGERIEVWISGGDRRAYIIPAHFVLTRFGLDYAKLRRADGTTIEVPIQRGREQPRPDMPDALEILSGLQAGDILVQP